MRSVTEILKMTDRLQRNLRKKKIVENFGDKEQRILDVFVGDIYEYPYQTRGDIQDIIKNFALWCMDFTG